LNYLKRAKETEIMKKLGDSETSIRRYQPGHFEIAQKIKTQTFEQLGVIIKSSCLTFIRMVV
jgi:hypothetical protein